LLNEKDDALMSLKKQMMLQKNQCEEKESNFLCKLSTATSEVGDLK